MELPRRIDDRGAPDRRVHRDRWLAAHPRCRFARRAPRPRAAGSRHLCRWAASRSHASPCRRRPALPSDRRLTHCRRCGADALRARRRACRSRPRSPRAYRSSGTGRDTRTASASSSRGSTHHPATDPPPESSSAPRPSSRRLSSRRIRRVVPSCNTRAAPSRADRGAMHSHDRCASCSSPRRPCGPGAPFRSPGAAARHRDHPEQARRRVTCRHLSTRRR